MLNRLLPRCLGLIALCVSASAFAEPELHLISYELPMSSLHQQDSVSFSRWFKLECVPQVAGAAMPKDRHVLRFSSSAVGGYKIESVLSCDPGSDDLSFSPDTRFELTSRVEHRATRDERDHPNETLSFTARLIDDGLAAHRKSGELRRRVDFTFTAHASGIDPEKMSIGELENAFEGAPSFWRKEPLFLPAGMMETLN